MKKDINNSIYHQMQRMAELTVVTVLAGNLGRATKLLNAAERLFQNGNYQTRNAVTNVYIYNVSSVLQLRNCNLQVILPYGLQKEYIKQINAF